MSESPQHTDRHTDSGPRGDIDDRRKYPRLKRQVFYRVPSFFDRWTKVRDVSVGGCRIYADEDFAVGKELIIDILLPDRSNMRGRARVVWTARQPEGSAALYEIGLSFNTLPDGGLDVLQAYLETEE